MRRPKMFAVLPTLLTLANAASGFGSITFAAKVGPEFLDGNHLFVAALLIFLAMVFDMFDGTAARWTNQTSEFGAQLDSLADTISFGVAPAFLMVQFCQHGPGAGGTEWFTYHPRLLWVIGVLFVLCAVLRLARFNVETEEDDSHEYFSGLPSPAAAGVVASFPIARRGLRSLIEGGAEGVAETLISWLIPLLKLSLPVITLAVACLMVSRIRYSHVFNQLIRGQRTRQQVIQLVFMLAVLYMLRDLALLFLPLLFCFFAFAAPIRSLWKEVLSRRLHKPSEV